VRNEIADFRIKRRPAETFIAARFEMQVVAALDLQRDGIAERAEHLIRPGPHRHHHLAGGDRALVGGNAPAIARPFEGPRVSGHEPPALAAEQRSIGFGQTTGVGHEARCRKMDRAGELPVQMRFARGNAGGIQNIADDAILPGALQLAHRMA